MPTLKRKNANGQWEYIQVSGLDVSQLKDEVDSVMTSLAEKASQSEFLSTSFYSNPIMFFPSYLGFLSGGQFEFYVTNDGKKFYNVNTDSVFKSKLGNVWDYSMTKIGDWFYIAFDSTFKINYCRTKDFITFEEIDMNLPSTYTNQWAPEWFINSDGSIYMLMSMSTNVDTSNLTDMSLYFVKFTDNSITSYAAPIKLVLPNTSTQKIDPFIIKNGSTYHLFYKEINNNNDTQIQHYTNTVIDGLTTWTFVQSITFNQNIEAPSVVLFNGTYYLYGDAFQSGKSMLKTSTDLLTWSADIEVGAVSGVITRHFTPLVISNQTDIDLIKNLTVTQSKKNTFNTNTSYLRGISEQIFKISQQVDLNALADTNGTIAQLAAKPNTLYYNSSNRTVTVSTIGGTNLKAIRASSVIYFQSQNANSPIVLSQSPGTGFTLPNNQNYVLNGTNGLQNAVVPLIKINDDFKLMQPAITPFLTWVNAALTNSFTVANSNTVQSSRDIVGTVTIRGDVSNGTLNSVIFTLPTNSRPPRQLTFIVYCDGGTAVIQVNVDGTVKFVSSSSPTWSTLISLNITFKVV